MTDLLELNCLSAHVTVFSNGNADYCRLCPAVLEYKITKDGTVILTHEIQRGYPTSKED